MVKKVPLLLVGLLNAYLLSEAINIYSALSTLKYSFVFMYLLVFQVLIVIVLRKIRAKQLPKKNEKIHLIISIVISVLVFGAGGGIVKDHGVKATEITVKALSEKNDRSQSNEVWLTNVIINGKKMDLSRLDLPEGWKIRENAIFTPLGERSSPLRIDVPRAENVELIFLSHPWSGRVLIKDGNAQEKLDLYSSGATSFQYNVKSNKISLTDFEKIALGLSFISLITCLTLLVLKIGAYYRKDYALLFVYLYWLIFILTRSLSVSRIMDVLLILLSLISGLVFNKIIKSKCLSQFVNTRFQKIMFLLVTFYSSIAIINNQVFMMGEQFHIDLNGISIFLLFSIWIISIEILFLFSLDWISRRISRKKAFIGEKKKSSLYTYWIFIFVIEMLIWCLYLIAFNPANMSPDSISQWKEALGIEPLSDWHPAFHTLIIRLIINIYPSPSLVAIVQMIFGAAVIASFLIFLIKYYGMSHKMAIFVAVLFSSTPNNGVNIVTLWKDIPYTISLLWLTLLLARLVTQKRSFAYSWLNLFFLSISLAFVYLFRHNGLVPFICSIVFLLIWVLMKKNYKLIFSIAGALIIVLCIKGIIYPTLKVIPNPPGVQYAAPVHGIASAVYYGGELSQETQSFMEGIMPKEEWKRLYNPYSADPYIFDNPYNFTTKISQYSASKIVYMYIDTLIKNPGIVLSDRLNGLNLLWDFSQPQFAYNNKFSNGVFDNSLGLTRHKNRLTSLFSKILDFSGENPLLNVIIWRGGVYLILLLITSYYCIIRKLHAFWVLVIPCVTNILSLIVSMAWQDYRYVYFEFYLTIFIFLFVIYSRKNDTHEASDEDYLKGR
jgi:hypothetical protein